MCCVEMDVHAASLSVVGACLVAGVGAATAGLALTEVSRACKVCVDGSGALSCM